MNIDVAALAQILRSSQPVLILCAGGLLCLLIDAWWPRRMSLLIYGMGILTLLLGFVSAWAQWRGHLLAELPPVTSGLIQMNQFTIAIILIMFATGLFTLLNALGYVKIHETNTSEFCALTLFALVGMVFMVASDNLIVIFIGLEMMSLSVYVLVGSHKRNFQSGEAAVKYFLMGGVASAIMLYGIALFYGGYATFSIAAITVSNTSLTFLRNLGMGMILTGLFFKLAVVPFHFWAPDVYEGAPAPVTGFMATAVKIAAFGLAVRLFSEFRLFDVPLMQNLLTGIVAATLIVPNVVAVFQDNVKRMLAYSSISHAGFILMGLIAAIKDGVYDKSRADVVVFYLIVYTFMTLGAFAVLSLLTRKKSEATGIGDLRGLAEQHPALAAVFAVFMLALTGIPPTAGFAAKYNVIQLAVANDRTGLAVLAVIASVISAFYYLRPIVAMYFKPAAERDPIPEQPLTILVSIVFCLVATMVLGIFPDPFLGFSQLAAK